MVDWFPEDTEILQLLNRIRHLFTVRDNDRYQAFIKRSVEKPDEGGLLQDKLQEFRIHLYRDGKVVVYDAKTEVQRKILEVQPLKGAARPQYTWCEDTVRNRLIPAIDREMILDDLAHI